MIFLEEGDEDEKETVSYSVLSEVAYFNAKATRLVFIFQTAAILTRFFDVLTKAFNLNFRFSALVIKRGTVVEADKSFTSQLRLMNLSDGSPYETLHSFVSNAVAPYFKSYIRTTGKAIR